MKARFAGVSFAGVCLNQLAGLRSATVKTSRLKCSLPVFSVWSETDETEQAVLQHREPDVNPN